MFGELVFAIKKNKQKTAQTRSGPRHLYLDGEDPGPFPRRRLVGGGVPCRPRKKKENVKKKKKAERVKKTEAANAAAEF